MLFKKLLVFAVLYLNYSHIYSMELSHSSKRLCIEKREQTNNPKKLFDICFEICFEHIKPVMHDDPIQGVKSLEVVAESLQPLALQIAQKKDHNGSTLLHKVAYLGNIACVTSLLQLGVIRRVYNKWRKTPLMVAAKLGHIDVCALLFDRADLLDNDDCKILRKSLYALKRTEKSQKMLDQINIWGNWSDRHRPKARNSVDSNYINEELNNRERKDYFRSDCLIEAIRNGQYEIVKNILDHSKKNGWKPSCYDFLSEAVLFHHNTIVELLLEYGFIFHPIDLHAAIKSGNMHYVHYCCNKMNASFLDEYYEDISANKRTALFYALICENEEAIKILRSHGADLVIMYPHEKANLGTIENLVKKYNINISINDDTSFLII